MAAAAFRWTAIAETELFMATYCYAVQGFPSCGGRQDLLEETVEGFHQVQKLHDMAELYIRVRAQQERLLNMGARCAIRSAMTDVANDMGV